MQVTAQYPQPESRHQTEFKKYYLVEILDEQNQVLFTVKTGKSEVLSFFTAPNYRQRPPVSYLKRELYLFLPVYQKAVNLRISNEKADQIILINIKGIINQKKNLSQPKLCGNGICDQRENFLNCFADCGVK